MTRAVPVSQMNTGMVVDGPAGSVRSAYGTTAGSIRWEIQLADNSAESGSNAGSNFNIIAYTDAGTVFTTVLSINRVTGNVSVSQIPINPSDVATKQYVDDLAAGIDVSNTPPTFPLPGTLWFDTVGGQLYIWYDDGTSAQWVIAVNPPPPAMGNYLPLIGGTLTGPLVGTTAQFSGVVTAAGVIDGSNAAAGQIGEIISNSVPNANAVTLAAAGAYADICTLSLTAGDWDVYGDAAIIINPVTGLSAISASINTSAALPIVGMAGSRFSLAMAYSGTWTNFLPLRPVRASLSAPTTYHLGAAALFTSGTVSAAGTIWARRVR